MAAAGRALTPAPETAGAPQLRRTVSLPRARRDLEVHERVDDQGEPLFLVKDHASGRFCRLGPLPFTVLEMCEAEGQTLPALRARLAEEHGVEVTVQDLARIIGDLDEHTLLELSPAGLAAKGPLPRSLMKKLLGRRWPPEVKRYLAAGDAGGAAGALLLRRDVEGLEGPAAADFDHLQSEVVKYFAVDRSWGARLRRWRIPVVDPGRLLDRLLPVFRWTARFGGAWVLGVLFLLAAFFCIDGWDRWHADAVRLRSWPGLGPLIIFTLALCACFHELSHGLVCRHYGGQVRDMGVMLVYFSIPAAYCDISDAYFFPERHQRVWVGLAGCVANLVLWVIATLLWRVLAPDLLLTQACLVIMVTTGVGLIFNLNPLLPLDGYFVLCDVLRMENLRPRAVAYLFAWLGSKFTSQPAPEVTPREKRIFLTYGALAFAYGVSMVIGLLAFAWSTLVGAFRGVGVLLFALAVYFLAGGLLAPVWHRIRAHHFSGFERFAYATLLLGLGYALWIWA